MAVQIGSTEGGPAFRRKTAYLLATPISAGESGPSVYAKLDAQVTQPNLTWGAVVDKLNTQLAALPTPTLSLSSPTVAEGNAGTTALNFIAALGRLGLTGPVPFTWAVIGGTADASDYPGNVLPSGTGQFNAGSSNATVAVLVQGDTTAEPNETAILQITLVDWPSVVVQSTGTISDDDTPAGGGTPSNAMTIGGQPLTIGGQILTLGA